jgi:hypothetical protein
MAQKIEDVPGYEDIFKKILEELPPPTRLLGLTPEERLQGLAPKERLQGLTPEQQVLALADEVLRGFTDAYLCTLSPATQEIIRGRIGRPPPGR